MIHTLLPAKKSPARKAAAKSAMPLAVARWFIEHTKLPVRDYRRIKVLNARIKDETITAEEAAELDAILDACLKLDVLRAKATAALKRPQKSR